MEDKQRIIGSLAHWVATGKLDARVVLPAIEYLSNQAAQPDSPLALLEAIDTEPGTGLSGLSTHLRQMLRLEAVRFHEKIRQGQKPLGPDSAALNGLRLEVAAEWEFVVAPAGFVTKASRAVRDLGFAAANVDKAPQLFHEIKQSTAQVLGEANAALRPSFEHSSLFQQLETSWPSDAPGRNAVLAELRRRRAETCAQVGETVRRVVDSIDSPGRALDEETLLNTLRDMFVAAKTRDDQREVLDLLCSWPTPGFWNSFPITEKWAQDRAILNLTLRFGHPELQTWPDWSAWLSNQFRFYETEKQALRELVQNHPHEVMLILYSQLANREDAIEEALVKIICDPGAPVDVQSFIQTWSNRISLKERRALLGIPEPPPLAVPPVIAEVEAAAARAQAVPTPPRIPVAPVFVPPPRPPRPSIWENHIQPLFVENWYIVAGIAMVILGSSLLAYYTWDKHWLVRYTIMPSLLALFTWSLAGVGTWIENKSSEFRGTAAILRTAAIGLLPINFMAIALLSADEKVPQKVPALLVMAAIYLSVFGLGLRKWCGSVEPALRNKLAGALLFLNALVVVGPLAQAVAGFDPHRVLVSLGVGFYLGFAVTAWTIVHFTRKVLTREMAEEKRVPWFVAGALGITYVQVFVWVHGFMRHVPHAHTYALLVVATGWLILYAERRALELRQTPRLHGGESFLGFAFVGLGLLMGFGQPTVRIYCFFAAGIVWLFQALSRKDALHYWIALTLFGLGGAAIGLLPHYPGSLLPLLGIGLALAFGLGFWISQKFNDPLLAKTCLGMQVAALFITSIVAPLAQWSYASEPWITALWLLVVAVLLAWRALRDQKLHWLHATMLVLALALPYAGFMDVKARTAHHNTMVFGLAILAYLWLGVCRIASRQTPAHNWAALILQARSTVLWFYGSLAMTAMLLRVALGDAAPDPLWYRDFMDYTGPLLMMIALVPATYFSRSLIPAGMAVVIMAVLFPELRANLHQTLPWLSWGSGLSSSISALVLVWLCFLLRDWSVLKHLPDGDRFAGKELFPLRRNDYSLFTWPIVAAILFLLVKVDTWNLLHNFSGYGLPLKTAVALGITGIAWTFLGIYRRRHRDAFIGVHLGWIWMFAGILLGYWGQAHAPHWDWPFLVTGLLLQALFWLYRFGLEKVYPWSKSLLAEPTRLVLLVGSPVLTIVCVLFLLEGTPIERIEWLYLFLAAQLIWHGLARRNPVFGTILFFQVWVAILALTSPGRGQLLAQVSVEQSSSPTLWLLVGVQLLLLGIEVEQYLRERQAQTAGKLYQSLSPLLTPFLSIASFLAVVFGLAGIMDGVHWLTLSATQQALLFTALLLTARAHRSGFVLLLGALLGYLMACRPSLLSATTAEAHILFLITPWRIALVGLILVLIAQGGRWLGRRNKSLLAGPFVQPFFTAPSAGWMFWPAMIFSILGAFHHTFSHDLRESAAQLWSPYLGVLIFALVAWFWGRAPLFWGSAGFLLLGNIHLVRVFAGDFLRAHELSELHLLCLGISLTLLQGSILRRVLRAPRPISRVNLTSLGLACSILVLLSVNYFTEPDLTAISSARFIISGTMALLAGLYFRRAARQPGPGEQVHVALCEALYHFGVVLAIWCAALLIPWFRRPVFTLFALGLPALYFYLRAELGMRAARGFAARYRNSATVLGLVILGLYLFKGIFHMVLFPDTRIPTDHYHYNAPIVILLGLLLLRLHGLGGTSWLAFYGGLALMFGSYFLLTWLPGLSPFGPFGFPIPSAWCALGLGHFWILLSYSRSPVRTVVQQIARLDDEFWHSLRHWWGICLLIATQGATAWALLNWATDSYQIAPLLAVAATIFIHQAFIRSRRGVKPESRYVEGVEVEPIITSTRVVWDPISVFYVVLASIELTFALHMDFFDIPSYLDRTNVVWALLLIWLTFLVVYEFLAAKLNPKTIGRFALPLAAMVFAHVLYHHPWSNAGLWAFGLGACLAAWTPQRTRYASNALELACAELLLAVPAWLVYFSQVPVDRGEVLRALDSWPVLATTAAILLTGLFARQFVGHLAANYNQWSRSRFRLFDSTLIWLQLPDRPAPAGQISQNPIHSVGARIYRATLWLTLIVVVILQALHYEKLFLVREISLLVLLEAALAVAWWYEGKNRQSMLAYYLMQISALACFASVRRHLMLTTIAAGNSWNYEYDVWASLAFSLLLAGSKQSLQSRALRVPLLTTMALLPVVALVWVLAHGLSVNMALLVVGMHSVLFAYLGRDDRESPYNIVALAGFVAFILITFYSKLHLRAVHAYIIPTGLGILVLQELFRDRIKPDAKNWIRLVTLMAMLGSSAYYALVDPSHEIVFNMTMIILCLLSMAFGSVLRIRLYLAMGFAGLMVDLISILYKVLVHMERSARMTVIGSLVLGIGAALVFGAIYYKTNKDSLDAWLDEWRGKLAQWQ